MGEPKFKKFTDVELEKLKIYVEKTEELKNSRVLKIFSKSFETEINFSNPEGICQYSYTTTDKELILSFLVTFRQLYKEKILGTVINGVNYDCDKLLNYLFYSGAIHTGKEKKIREEITGTPLEPWIHFTAYDLILKLCKRIIWMSDFIKREILK
ncbi:MAG: hypothetical protein ACTSUT_05600 [Promethearchaeota archaeon]